MMRWEKQKLPGVIHVIGWRWYTSWDHPTVQLDSEWNLKADRPFGTSKLYVNGALIVKGRIVKECVGKRYPRVLHFFLEAQR